MDTGIKCTQTAAPVVSLSRARSLSLSPSLPVPLSYSHVFMQEHTHVCVCVCVYTRTYPQRIDGHGDQAHPNRRNRGWRVPINRRAALYYVGAEVCVCVCARARVRKRVKHSSCSRQHRYARHFIFILY